MSTEGLVCKQQLMHLEEGQAIGLSFRWPGGQYCVIQTDRGLLGCGIYDCRIATQFGMAVAICRGTPAHPLCEPEDLLKAYVAEVSQPAEQLGIRVGMQGSQAVGLLLRSSPK